MCWEGMKAKLELSPASHERALDHSATGATGPVARKQAEVAQFLARSRVTKRPRDVLEEIEGEHTQGLLPEQKDPTRRK